MPDQQRASPSAIRLTAIIAVAVAAGLVAWLLISNNGDDNGSGSGTKSGQPLSGKGKTVPISVQGLRTLAGALQQPIYWAGVKPGHKLELTQESDGRVFIRYLPHDAEVGTRQAFVTIGTYSMQNAYSATTAAANRGDSVKVPVPGGVGFYNSKTPTNIYFARPGANVQVEVYDPWAPGARKLVTGGSVVPVTGTSPLGLTTAPQALTLAGLKTFAKRVRHPVYWIGPRPQTTYEVTQTADGRIYVRYLPQGQVPGTDKPFLTVGTYPVKDALATTRTQSHAVGSVSTPAAAGAVAFFAKTRPTNVYEAFPGVDYQVEVYDPWKPGARRFVKAKRVTTI
jgi:hypothetical protein